MLRNVDGWSVIRQFSTGPGYIVKISGDKPLPQTELHQIYDATWRHQVAADIDG